MASRLSRGILSKCHLFRRAWTYTGYRSLLSAAYPCDDVWRQRLNTPVLQKVDVADFAMKLYDKFERDGIVSAIDIDILANKLEKLDTIQLDFAQTLFHKFRHSQESLNTQDSTPYALVRALLEKGETDKLLEILKDKVEYGVFLDYHLANQLLDHFIEHKQYGEAAEIAYDQMLQEDFEHPITWMLSWYACHLHWQNPVVPVEGAELEAEEADQDGDEDEEELDWVRLNFLEHPHYDDHFDLHKDSLKLGKTFTMVGGRSQDLLGRSYQLIGWGLYEKFDKGIQLMQRWSKDADIKEAATREAIDSFLSTLEGMESKEPPTEEKEVGMMTIEDMYPYITVEAKEEYLAQAQEVISRLESSGKIVAEYNMAEDLLTRVTVAVSQHQDKDIETQRDLFTHWVEQRRQLVESQVETFLKQQKQVELAKRLVALQSKEEKLRYFEELEKIKIGISLKRHEKPVTDVKEEELFVAAPGERGKAT